MDRKKIEKEIIRILADRLDIDIEKVKLESELVNDLGMDSLAAIEVTYAIKDRFGIDIYDSDFSKIEKVKDIVEKLVNIKNKKSYEQRDKKM